MKEGWIEEMIKREATPKPERTETVEDFCSRFEISKGTYEYHQRKPETKKEVVKIWLNEAINGGNEVLRKLKDNALEGKEKSIEMYLKFVLELKEKMDLTTDDKPIGILSNALLNDNSDEEDNATQETS